MPRFSHPDERAVFLNVPFKRDQKPDTIFSRTLFNQLVAAATVLAENANLVRH